MKVLLIGSGGREHALAWKLADSALVTALYVAPGNAGTVQLAENVTLDPMRMDRVERFVREQKIGFVVIGPEDPLAAGLADHLRKNNKVPVFGPSKEAAQVEADKWFAKELMRQQAIPTAEARAFASAEAAEEYVRVKGAPLVIKATGLAKGKGVTVAYKEEHALDAIRQMMREKVFGEAGSRVVIEEMLAGPEVSILALVNRSSIYVLESAQDHKAVDDGDTGPMTGGMGAYSPTPVITDKLAAQIEREILVRAVDGLRREGIDYSGVLYAGLMITDKGPKVLEFNCRFGDPETQPLMMRLKSDLAEALLAVAENRLEKIEMRWDPRPALCVVATSKGYPGKYAAGVEISGIAEADAQPDTKVFHAGTKLAGGKVVSDGGRVLAVTSIGKDIAEAQKRAYRAMEMIHFDGMHYRRDIGHQAIRMSQG